MTTARQSPTRRLAWLRTDVSKSITCARGEQTGTRRSKNFMKQKGHGKFSAASCKIISELFRLGLLFRLVNFRRFLALGGFRTGFGSLDFFSFVLLAALFGVRLFGLGVSGGGFNRRGKKHEAE